MHCKQIFGVTVTDLLIINPRLPYQTAMLDLAEAFLYQLDGPPSNHHVVHFARKIVSNIHVLKSEDDYTRVPMHSQMYWSHSVNMLVDEVERLQQTGFVAGKIWRSRALTSITPTHPSPPLVWK